MIFNKRTMLAIGSLFGLTASVGFAIKDTFRAKALIDEKKPEGFIETVKVAAPCYICTGLGTVCTAVSIMAGYHVGTKEIATATGFGIAATNRYQAYRKVVRDELGEEKEKEIYAMAVEKDLTIFPALPSSDNVPNTLFYDVESETFFRSTTDKVQQAIYHMNRNFHGMWEMCALDWYDFLGVPLPYEKHEELKHKGWSMRQFEEWGYEIPWIDLYCDYVSEPGREPYYRLYFDTPPNEEALSME